MKFPLVNRTHYSILRAFTKPEALVQKAKALGYDSVGLCDIETVSGAVEFIEACKAENIRPIIGCELGGYRIFAKNIQGWKLLVSLTTEWNCHERLNRESLGSSDLIVLSTNLPESKYLEKTDEEFYAILRAMELKTTVRGLAEPTACFHLLSKDELPDDPSYGFFDSVVAFNVTGPPKLPHFEADGKREIDLLKELIDIGFEKVKGKLSDEEVVVYLKRIAYEVKVIDLANLAGYFLIVQDFVAKARRDGQLAAIGRGSAAGSLVSYLIGINLVNPIPYGLLFSRFFNAARSYPKHLSFDEHPFIDVFRDFESKS